MSKEGLFDFIDETGDSSYDFVEVQQADNELDAIVGQFYLRVEERARALGLSDTGNMLSKDNFGSDIKTFEDKTEIDLYMVYYADYVNRGVQGKLKQYNAPDSPYKFKNLGMSEEGRKSILRRVTEGKEKASDPKYVKYGKVGLEAKSQDTPSQADINEREAARIIYLIKAYGIKTTNFINDAWSQWIKDIKPDLPRLIAPRVIAQLKILNK